MKDNKDLNDIFGDELFGDELGPSERLIDKKNSDETRASGGAPASREAVAESRVPGVRAIRLPNLQPEEPMTEDPPALRIEAQEGASIRPTILPPGAETSSAKPDPVRTEGVRTTKPPRAHVVRSSYQANPLRTSEIQAKNKEIRTPLPRVDEILPKAQAKQTVETAARPTKQERRKPGLPARLRQLAAPERTALDFFNRRLAGLLLLISAVLEIGLLLTWLALPDGFFGLEKYGFSGHIVATALTQLLLVLLPSVAILKGFRIPAKDVVGSGEMSFSLGLLSFIIGIPAGLALHALNNILIYALTSLDVFIPDKTLPGLVMPDDGLAWPLLIIVTVLAPAVFEELMFRGIILPQMAKSKYLGSSLVLSALGFALFHDDPMFWLAPLGAGLILGFLRLKSDTLFSPMLSHAAMNLSILFISPLLPSFTSRLILSLGRDSTGIFYANLIISLVMGLLLIPLLIRFNTMSAPPVDLFGEDGQLIGEQSRRRVFFVKKEETPTDYSRILEQQKAQNPYFDVFFWLGCLALLLYLLSAYFIRV